MVASPVEAEKYIRFQLEQMAVRNEHHLFEEICYRIAKRRLSSNLLPATGPVSAGGDQGRDAESYYTRLPKELPSSGGFVGRATSEPLVVACSVQKDGLEAKIRADVKKIREQGAVVKRIAFFAVQDVPVAMRHRVQEKVREAHGVALEIFDGQAVSHLLAEADLVWVAERYLDLPSHLVPDSPEEPQPSWYAHTLKAIRQREAVWCTPGTFSEVRDGLRHSTFDDNARSDLPEWLEYMREFTADDTEPELAIRARYECAVATLRGLGTLAGVEDDIRMVLDHALSSESSSVMEDASILLMYWGGAWARHLANAAAEELRERNLALRIRADKLLAGIDETKQPNRAARLLAVAAHLCLHPRWPEANRPPTGTLLEPREMTLLRSALKDAGETAMIDPDTPVDGAEALGYLHRLVDLLPAAQVFPVGSISETFQMLAPVLMRDPRYAKVRDSLDAAVAAVEGGQAIAGRRRARAMAFRRAGRLLESLAELHEIKMDLWHGDTLRGALITIRSIGQIYAELQMPHAAKLYALAAAGIALTSEDAELHDLGPEALIDVMDDCHAAGAWGDAMAVANLAATAHGEFAEDAFNPEVHASLQRLDFHTMLVLLAAERFRPAYSSVLRSELGQTSYMQDLVTNGLETVRSAFDWTEDVFIWHADEQLSGRPFSDLGRRRTLTFAALGTVWQITCSNNRQDVLAAERLAAALQILIVELAPHDPVFLPQDVHLELITGTRLAGRSPVRFKPSKDRAECSVVLTPFTEGVDEQVLSEELDVVAIYLLKGLSARPDSDFMTIIDRAVRDGLIHKIHLARPYDDLARLLDDGHYDALAAVNAIPWHGKHALNPPELLRFPGTAGPGYVRDASLDNVRENYQYIPSLINQTLRRALENPEIVSGFRSLRNEGWLDWHLLTAVLNAAINFRAQTAGLLRRPDVDGQEEHRALVRTPETPDSSPVPLALLSPGSLRTHMQLAILAIAQRRWNLSPNTPTPDISAFKSLISSRYGLNDDVPHRDLLHGALGEDGDLLDLIGD